MRRVYAVVCSLALVGLAGSWVHSWRNQTWSHQGRVLVLLANEADLEQAVMMSFGGSYEQVRRLARERLESPRMWYDLRRGGAHAAEWALPGLDYASGAHTVRGAAVSYTLVAVSYGWLMIPPAVGLGVVVLLGRRDRRRVARHQCRECGYGLRATPDRCPECGAVPGAVGGRTQAPAGGGTIPAA
jgi:hypothetical protein